MPVPVAVLLSRSSSQTDKMLQKLLALVLNAGLGLALVTPFRLQHHAWLQIESLCCSLGNTATIFLKLHPKLLQYLALLFPLLLALTKT